MQARGLCTLPFLLLMLLFQLPQIGTDKDKQNIREYTKENDNSNWGHSEVHQFHQSCVFCFSFLINRRFSLNYLLAQLRHQ